MDSEIEKELRDYLRAQKEADSAGAVRSIADWCTRHDADDKVRHAEIQGGLRGLSLRVGALERSDEKLEDKLERSGSWDREALQAQAHLAHEASTWWKRQWVTWLVAGLAAAVGAAFSWVTKGK